MEASLRPRGEQPVQQTGTIEDSLASIHPIRPDVQDGFFNIEDQENKLKAVDRNPVVNQELLQIKKTRHGTTSLNLVTMENGRHYEVVTGEPKTEQSIYPVVFTTALGTSIRGHNWHTMHRMMDLGYPTVLIGPEGGHAKWPRSKDSLKRFMHNLAHISLEETSRNMHEIIDFKDTEDLYEPGKTFNIGESRGAMAGLIYNAVAKQYDRVPIYSDHTAPCFPNGLSQLTEHLVLPGQLVTQTNLFGNLPLKVHPRRALSYPRTINPNPHYLMHMVANVPTLLKGSTGRFARTIDTNAVIHNTIFDDDAWSDGDEWDRIFADHPNVVNDHRPGTHMAIAREDTLDARLDRMRVLRDEMSSNHFRPEKVNWLNVHNGGRLAVAAA
ncbi:MAG: hypothetical protein NVS1B10_00500 [Candidatus Saccharimonadales bacterium]